MHSEILEKYDYEAVVGVTCEEEIKLSARLLEN